VLGGREDPASRLELRHTPEPLDPRRVEEVLLRRLSGDAVGARVEDVLVDGVGDEAAPLVGVTPRIGGPAYRSLVVRRR
jgi:hypothetical protein